MYSNETKIYIAIIAGSLMLTAILLAYILTFVRHQKQITRSYLRQIDIEVNTLERERRRISWDLHDDLGPFLSSMKLQINLLNIPDPDDVRIVNELTAHLNEIVKRIREISEDLMPDILISMGLVRAIESRSVRMNEIGKLSVQTYFDPADMKLPPSVELHLFRIFQETLNNTVKHSNAQCYALKLLMFNKKLLAIIEDNGSGFNYQQQLINNDGKGLKNITARVDILKGTMQTDTAAGKGIRYKIHIPL